MALHKQMGITQFEKAVHKGTVELCHREVAGTPPAWPPRSAWCRRACYAAPVGALGRDEVYTEKNC